MNEWGDGIRSAGRSPQRGVLLLAALSATVLAATSAPASAARDGTTCNYTDDPPGALVLDLDPRTGQDNQLVVYVHPTSNGSGISGQADAAAGACMNEADGGDFQGGTVEAGVGLPSGTGPAGEYVVADGDDDNLDPVCVDNICVNALRGYIGVSNFETGPAQEACTPGKTPPDNGSGTNSGGCLNDKQPLPLLVCGNTSGERWEATPRDGCSNILPVP